MLIRKAGFPVLTIALLFFSSTRAVDFSVTSIAASRVVENQVSTDRIAKHIQFLASDKLQGRRAGTPSADQAAEYIESEFRKYGLKPGSSSGFLQSFSFVSSVKLGDKNSLQYRAPGVSRVLKIGEEFMPLAFSPSQPLSGDAVFVGYGISAPELGLDSYSGIDPKGKIVLVLRGSPDGDNPHGKFAEFTQPGLEIQNKTLKAREKGASGVLFVSAEKSFYRDRLSQLRHDLNFLDSGIPTAVISRDVAVTMLEAAGKSLSDAEAKAKEPGSAFDLKNFSIQFKTDVVKVNGKSSNVVGTLRGSDPQLSSEWVVIGAHYDHLGMGGPESLAAKPEGDIHHGADDNASGTTGLLEIARVLATEPTSLKRSIMFIAFSGEELGLLGSGAYTKTPAAPLGSTIAMLNMDMIGRLRDDKLFFY